MLTARAVGAGCGAHRAGSKARHVGRAESISVEGKVMVALIIHISFLMDHI